MCFKIVTYLLNALLAQQVILLANKVLIRCRMRHMLDLEAVIDGDRHTAKAEQNV